MKKSILSLAAAAAISGAFTIPVQAEDVKVKDGDTLWGISQTYKVSVEDIKSWNDLSSDAIYAGETIHISQEEHYKVKSGDTLSGIAHKYDVGVNDIKSWNGLSSDTIHPGQEIVIKPAANKVEAASVGPAQKSGQAAQAEQSEPAEQTKPTEQTKPAEQTKPVEQSEPADSNNESQDQAESGKEITVSATAYTADCQGCSGTTATGVDLKANPDAKVIAVDPSVIPLGSKVYVEGYGYATAADTGSAIKGNRVDIFVPNEQDAVNWGVKNVKVQILN
ncbi:3D domain-containing protein [Peribacillus frigoritolerans]|uniref:3D domain-containing protein n=1 Tax=Peribacillus frigoritolerans TaxID=450367 RepID=UPI000BF6ADFB|nr:3D domain-containing protein [Peribacillus frigoritolerans]MBD8137218.1 LysM peptidoglycan-binding domain-containing protein [Bacillus sp. CFBP 13597]MCR8868220.1 LysM peptidoglycan-binding domain-containing protein [Peribacillus frigoritolerans]MCY8940009.1 LysM peptidoglycan-binding domain-containing protein [Peribacillus frigoritolerans]PEO49344.1 peptidoglycan-binding protein [Bacillus sp. AFS026049]